MSDFKQAALDYHAKPRPGKTSVELTKPTETARDLALAYSPGVAEPVREIARDPELAYQYTNKGNLVAVISDGTAILGLGNDGVSKVQISWLTPITFHLFKIITHLTAHTTPFI